MSRRGYYSFNTYSKRVAADLAETTHGRVVAARGHPDSPAVAVLGNVVELVVGHRVPAFLAGRGRGHADDRDRPARSEEHTSELQSLMRISYAVFCLKKKKRKNIDT